MTNLKQVNSETGVIQASERCRFCGLEDDSIAHITRCQFVLASNDLIRFAAQLPQLRDGREALMLQADMDGSVIVSIVAFYTAVWRVRSMCRRGIPVSTPELLADLILTNLQCPWLSFCLPTQTRAQRRESRLRPPRPIPNTTIYRSDGASRGQGNTDPVAG